MNIQDIKANIAHTTDGPVDLFVIIARAIELARVGAYPKEGLDDPIANALYELVADYTLEDF